MSILKKLRTSPFQAISVPAIILSAGPAFAAVYLTLEEAQQALFPGDHFTLVSLDLSDQEKQAIKEKAGVEFSFKKQKVWRAAGGGYLIVDEVIGKHEYITFALGINADGSIRQVEIMEYREAYGDEVRQKKWRKQFVGKTAGAALELNRDIKNISGATLSCRHVTEGVKRALAVYEIVLKKI